MDKKEPTLEISKRPREDSVYEQVWTVQEAINKAVATNKAVRFMSTKSNEKLRKEIVDMKGCKILKPNKFSNDIAVVPPSIKNFDFNDVDTSVILTAPRGGLILP